MFCTNCGKQNPNENRFCQYCGTKMEMVPPAPTPSVPAAPAPAPAPAPASLQYAPAPPASFVGASSVASSEPSLPSDTIEVDPVVVSPLFANASEGPRVVRSASEPAPASAPEPAPAPAPEPANGWVPPAAPVRPPEPASQPASEPASQPEPAATPAAGDASSSAGLTGLSGLSGVPDDAGNLILERENGERLPVTVFPATVGKGSVANVRIANNTAVSRAHLRISRVGGSMMAEDLGSTNYTYLNGERMREGNPVCLKNGDQLRLGDENIKVEITK